MINEVKDKSGKVIQSGVERGAKDYNRVSFANGQPASTIFIYQLPGANALELADKIEAKMSELSGNFTEGLKYDIPFGEIAARCYPPRYYDEEAVDPDRSDGYAHVGQPAA